MIDFARRSFLSLIPAASIVGQGALKKLGRPDVLPTTFRDISSQFIHPATSKFQTLGYLDPGDRGHAGYVSDHLATTALAALAPRFCNVSADGRLWRAATTSDGLVPVAAGGAIGSLSVQLTSLVDDRPAIAQALLYQQSIGASGLSFNDGNFAIWCPLRTAPDNDVLTDQSGVPFLLNGPTTFVSGPNGTSFHRRKFDGSDPSAFEGTQYLSYNAARNGQGIYWRGGMFFLVGKPDPRPLYSELASLTLKGTWNISGGILQSQPPAGLLLGGATPYYILQPNGSGWDITDKPILAAAGNTGDIVFDGDITIGGFRGELLYQADDTHGSIYQTGTLLMHDTDGDAFCPGPSFSNGTPDGYGTVQMQSLRIMNAFQALEGGTGWNSYIRSIKIANCFSGGGLVAGIWGPQAQPADRPLPTLTVNNLHVTRCNNFGFYSGNVFNIVNAVDCALSIGQNNWGTNRVIVNEVTISADKMSIEGLTFFGTPDQGSCGTFDNHIGTLKVTQSANAKLNDFCVFNAVDWYASLGEGNIINRLTGFARIQPCSENASSVLDYSPQIKDNALINGV